MSASSDLWDSLVADVITLTNRPELTAETSLGVRNGLIRAHLCDQFPRDMQTSVLTNAGVSTTLFTIDSSALTRFRTISAARLLDVDGNVIYNPEIEVVELGNIYDPDYPGVRKQNICYQAGTNLNIYVPCGTYGCSLDWFQSPAVTRDTITSWIAQMFPDVIIWEAAAFVWNRTGNTEKAREAMVTLKGTQQAPETGLYSLLKMNYGLLAGR